MFWIPIRMLGMTFGSYGVLRQMGRPARGLRLTGLDVILAAGYVTFVVLFIAGLDIGAAERTWAWLVRACEMYPPAVMVALALPGLLLATGDATGMVDGVVLADTAGSMPNTLTPALACGPALVSFTILYPRL